MIGGNVVHCLDT